MSDSSDPTLCRDFKGHRKQVTGLSFLPNDRELASSAEDNTIMLWNIASKDVRCIKFEGHSKGVTDIDCALSGKLLASSSLDSTVRIWVPTVRGGSSEIRAHFAPVTTVQFSPDGKHVCTGSHDKSVKIWDVARRKFLLSLFGHNNWVSCARYMPDGKSIVSCADDKSFKLWDITTKQCVQSYPHPRGSAVKVAPHLNGTSIAVAMTTGSVRIYDIRMKKMQQHYILHDKTTSVTWHPEGTHLLTAGMDGTIKIVDVLEGRPLYTIHGAGRAILATAFSRDGTYFACAGADRNVMIWQSNIKQGSSSSTSSLTSSSNCEGNKDEDVS